MGSLRKRAGSLRKRRRSGRSKSGQEVPPEHLAAALDIPLKTLRDGWRATGEKGDTSAFESRALSYYLKRLRLNGKRFAFAKPFKVLYYSANTLVEGPVCFNLVFATRHEKGLFVMNDAMADALAKFYRDVYSDSFFPTFVAEREQQDGGRQ